MPHNIKIVHEPQIIIIVYYAKWQHRQKYNYIHKIQKYIHKTEHKNRLQAKITVHTLLKKSLCPQKCRHKLLFKSSLLDHKLWIEYFDNTLPYSCAHIIEKVTKTKISAVSYKPQKTALVRFAVNLWCTTCSTSYIKSTVSRTNGYRAAVSTMHTL